jgi:hypothetical protein
MVIEERSEDREVAAIRAAAIAAAIRYRDAMREYMAQQVAAIDTGVSLEDLVLHNQAGFQAAAREEEELFALLDALEATRTRAAGAGSTARAVHPGA